MIKAFIPWVGKTEKIVITGDSDRLGNWDPTKGMPFKRSRQFFFISDLKIDKGEQWKLVLIQGNDVTWEEGDNRIGAPSSIVNFRGRRQEIGIEIPIFSLRSPLDNGIGDFGSLLQFIEEKVLEKYKVVQLLPINDTGICHDPFETVSAFAINPIYLCIDKIGILKDIETAHSIADRSEELQYSQIVEWEEARQIKWQYFEAIYAQDGEATLKSSDFRKFMESEKDWILPYCVFNYLKHTGKLESYSPALVEKLSTEKDVLFYAFLQFHADRQLQEIHAYCSKNSIFISCELPFGVSPDSADVWQNPRLFHTDFNVGTMPDAECNTGHKWNRVPFNWKDKGMERWWKARLKKMARYFDICRLDNTIGYFRQWIVPRTYGTAIRGQIEPCTTYSTKDLKASGYDAGGTKDLEPLITKEYLQTLFGPEFKRFGEFFKRKLDGRYYFKQNMGSTAEICNYFDSRKGDEDNLRQGLIRIMDECLFIKTARGYQPRIAAQYTNAYRALDEKQKGIFNTLYDNFYYSINSKLWSENGIRHLRMLANCSHMLLYADCKAPAGIEDIMFLAVERRGEKAGGMDVYMPSTYDMAPFKEWWSSLPETDRQVYWTEVMNWRDRASSKPINAIYANIVHRMKRSESPLVILPFQDLCPRETDYNGINLPERIVNPEKREIGWRWRVLN